MKKILALAAAAVLLLAGASKLNAQPEEDYYYGFITSCGVEDYVISEHEMEDVEALDWADWFEFYYCDLGGHL